MIEERMKKQEAGWSTFSSKQEQATGSQEGSSAPAHQAKKELWRGQYGKDRAAGQHNLFHIKSLSTWHGTKSGEYTANLIWITCFSGWRQDF